MNPEENSVQQPTQANDNGVPVVPPSTDPLQETIPVADNQVAQPVPSSTETSTDTQPISPESTQPAINNNALFDQIVEKIIEQQEAIIGPVAVEQARKVQEIKINWPQHDVDIEGNPQSAIDELVDQYKELFGQIAVQVSKEAVAAIMAQLPPDQQPKSLQ